MPVNASSYSCEPVKDLKLLQITMMAVQFFFILFSPIHTDDFFLQWARHYAELQNLTACWDSTCLKHIWSALMGSLFRAEIGIPYVIMP